MELIHISAAYSNAVLVAILPHVSDFAKKLELPIPQPITVEQVLWFRQLPYKDEIGGGLELTNHYWFSYDWHGYVNGFRSPNDPFTDQDPARNWPNYVGKANMTTNAAIEFARQSLSKLGYSPANVHADGQPTDIKGPYHREKNGAEIPFYRIYWEGPAAETPNEVRNRDEVRIDIDLSFRRVVGLSLSCTNAWRAPPEIGIQPELESDYLKRTKPRSAKMFIRTNAPARVEQPRTTLPREP
jgi:hypothetical protein